MTLFYCTTDQVWVFNLRQFLKELCLFLNLEYWKYTVFRTFLLHASTYWADILHMTLLVHLSRRLKCTIVITRCPSSVRPSLTFHIFDFSSETTEQNSTKLDRMQELNILYQVCVFRADRKNKMAALASDWLRHFRLLLWNRWTEFNVTWQEARSQGPLPSLCFSGQSEKQDGRPGLWLAETFSTSPLKPPNWIQRNLPGSKISTSSTKFVFFRPMSKQKCLPWRIPQKGGTLYSGARYVALWASCFTVLQIKLECCQFASISVGDMPLLELRILEIHSIPHFPFTYFDIFSWNFTYEFVCTDQIRVSSICVNFCRSNAPFWA